MKDNDLISVNLAFIFPPYTRFSLSFKTDPNKAVWPTIAGLLSQIANDSRSGVPTPQHLMSFFGQMRIYDTSTHRRLEEDLTFNQQNISDGSSLVATSICHPKNIPKISWTTIGGGMTNTYLQYCCEFRAASLYVLNWLMGQPNVGEESLTDWLLHTLSTKVPRLIYRKFTKHEEARSTGADWEWWFVDSGKALCLRIQAKKISHNRDNYDGLAHTNRYGLQIEKLISDARVRNSLPFYAFYHAPLGTPAILCQERDDVGQKHGVFIADAVSLYEEHISPGRRRVDADTLMARCNPLPCLVCCKTESDGAADPVDSLYAYLTNHYFENMQSGNDSTSKPGLHHELPEYVRTILKPNSDHTSESWEKDFSHQIDGLNAIVISDLREDA